MKLVIEKIRTSIILKYAPKLEKEMLQDTSGEDLEFIKNLIKNDKDGIFRSSTLSIILEAYSDIDRAFIPELPLELALIRILGQDNKAV
jgi:hypothetical protein